MESVLSNLDLLVEYNGGIFNTFKQLNAINLLCAMPKKEAVVMFPEVNYELSLVMENVKRESWRQSTSSP
jgi:hypothetical protein